MTTSRERVASTMALEVPDRVPVFCQLSIGHYFLHARPTAEEIWFRSAAFAEALVELQQRYRFDGILVNLPGRDPEFDRHIDRIERRDGDGETWIWWKNGNYTRVPDDDNPHYFQVGGKRYFPRFSELDPESLWYIEPWDITEITYPFTWGFDESPRPPDDFFPPYHDDPLRAVRDRVGAEVSVHAEVFSPFSQFLELLDYQNALMALLDDPEKVHAVLARLTLGAEDLAKRHIAAGADAILISSAFAGAGFISRATYESFVLPYEKQLIDAVRAAHPEIPLYTHTCGAIGDRLDLMLQTGTAGIDTLDPPPLGTVELADAVERLQGKAFIKGNIDPVHTLLRGDEETLREAVLQRLEVAAPGGGYILSSACSVAPGVRPEMLEYMSELVREHGVY